MTTLDQAWINGSTKNTSHLAKAYALAHVERSVVVVLATDGLPTTCAPTDTRALALLAKAALEGPAHVRTLVVASRSLDGTDLSSFETIARAGGTERSLVIDPRADFTGQLTSALTRAAAREVACDLAIPEPSVGAHLDYDAVNVVLDSNDDRVLLPTRRQLRELYGQRRLVLRHRPGRRRSPAPQHLQIVV